MEVRVNENQFGARVPTEYEAIKNLTKKPETRVAHYDKPTIDERQRAADIYNDSINAGMSNDEALEMVRLTTGMDDKWLKCVPDWAHRVQEHKEATKPEEPKRKNGVRYAPEMKRKAAKIFVECRKQGVSETKAVQTVNEKLGISAGFNTILSWLPKSYHKNRSDMRSIRYWHTEEDRAKAVSLYHEYKKTMTAVSACRRISEELGFNVSEPTMFSWVRKMKAPVAEAEHRTCECGHSIPSDYVFCPYCGKRKDTLIDELAKYCEGLIDKATDDAVVGKLKDIYGYIKERV